MYRERAALAVTSLTRIWPPFAFDSKREAVFTVSPIAVYSETDRAELLGGLECVAAVIIFTEETPERIIRAIRPEVLVKGAEYSMDQVPGAEFVLSCGGAVELLEMIEGRSTSRTVERIRSG